MESQFLDIFKMCSASLSRFTVKSAVAQHGSTIQFEDTAVLHGSSSWHERVIKESMEISLAGKSILNQEKGTFLSKDWLPALSLYEKVGGTFK